jgi:hypothetical protein
MAKKSDAATAAADGPALRITARKDGWRRAGMAHSGSVVHPAGTFDADQVAALKADPNLIVEETAEKPKA